ncbi:hypothetical protein GCM10022261_11140 [Brevibacterium daeguense]|uniref:Uncharacterized protein n=1 Tax=Brevibacterium daeguense TaxID=909936 RepID=A0ABP8EI36_9MICO|nr:hypothetical protein [Brevibacterium daeguense]
MLRLLELIGLVAPVVGGVLLFRYRGRSGAAFGWGMAACVLGLLSSGIGLSGQRLSIVAAFLAGDGTAGVLELMDGWALLRFALLFTAGLLLVVAALVDRRGAAPLWWLIPGALLVVAGVGLHFVHVDLGADHERLTAIATVLLEILENGTLGLGFLVLCCAAVAHREGNDALPEPAVLARSAGATIWQVYRGTQGGPRR